MAECHPVGFQWVMEARERGAEIIHVDPRFTRTSAVAGEHVPIRVGTDIAFLGGLINHVLQGEHYFHDYVLAYTNAASLVDPEYVDSEDLDGVFSGFDEAAKDYDTATAPVRGVRRRALGGAVALWFAVPLARLAPCTRARPTERDETLQHPRCVMQVLRRHFARYTPEMVERICGIPQDQFARVADAIVRNSGRERTTAFVYSVGWTHRTTGVQYIRAASILQLLLGNMGRPGGGIMALRGHASIQGSTDIPTLFNILPGYIPMPEAGQTETLADYVHVNTPAGGFGGHTDAYITSLLKAWWGDAATEENDFAYGNLPKLTGDHSIYPTIMGMHDGEVEGFFVMGENPTVGSANSKLHRLGMANLKWLVIRDLQQIESATFWKDGPEIETGELVTEDIGTEVFFLPAAAHVEKDGSFTNTQRLIQWHNKAVEPPDDCRSELHFMFHLIRRIREKLALAGEPERDRPILDLTWDYPTEGPNAEPDAEAVAKEVSGYVVADGKAVSGFTELKADGSTACGCWIYSGQYADGVNQTARRKPGSEQTEVAPEWGWAWPMNRRILYNRASADPAGNPWSERKKHVWWDAEAGKWTGKDVPDFKADMPPDHVPGAGDEAEMALRGDAPFIMQPDGKGWLWVPVGLADGPLPTHYEPHESPVRNPLYPDVQASPTRMQFPREDNRYNPTAGDPGADVFPFALLTYRIAEHHTAGGMSRFLPYLSELAPDPFVEVSPELAELRGLTHGEWCTIVTMRTAIEARAMVTDRMRPQDIDGQTVHTVGAALPLGPERPGDGRRGQRPDADRARPQREDLRVQGGDLRRPAGQAAARRGAAGLRRRLPEASGRHEHRDAADGLLHRHVAVHRLQGVRGRLQGVERGPRGRPGLPRAVHGQHGRARRLDLAPRRVHRAARGGPGRRHALADELRRLQALHGGGLPRGLPHRLAVPHGARDRRRPGGHLQRLRLLRPGLPVRGARPPSRRRPGPQVHPLLRPASATTRSPPARKACPTKSIQFGELETLQVHARGRVEELQERGEKKAQLYLDSEDGNGIGGAGAFFLLLDEPEVYGLPPAPVTPTRNLRQSWGAAFGAAAVMAGGVAAAVWGTSR